MPVTAKQIDGKWRVVEAATGKLATNKSGTPLDGKGHATQAGAQAQAAAINISLHKRGKA